MALTKAERPDLPDVPRQNARVDSLLLPKVSVIIVNYNYQSYLETAFDSVIGQTYPNIEIIIVDDKSTDDSCAVIDRICRKYSNVIPVKLEMNGGQSIASLRGIAASSGPYVVFLDADDQLLPQCVEAHVYTHLSSRIPVAFTTVDILNNALGQDINMSHPGFSDYVQSERGQKPKAIRLIDKSMPNSWFAERTPVIDAHQMNFVLPPYVDPWIWSPTSANCFRRDAVTLLLQGADLGKLRWGTDAYMIRPMSALFGSILIDAPLMRYVIHTDNRFIKNAPLNNLLIFDTGSTEDHMRDMLRAGVRQLMAAGAKDGSRYPDPRKFFEAMKAVSNAWPGPKADESPDSFYADQLLTHERAFRTGFGEAVVSEEFKKIRDADRKRTGFLKRIRQQSPK